LSSSSESRQRYELLLNQLSPQPPIFSSDSLAWTNVEKTKEKRPWNCYSNASPCAPHKKWGKPKCGHAFLDKLSLGHECLQARRPCHGQKMQLEKRDLLQISQNVKTRTYALGRKSYRRLEYSTQNANQYSSPARCNAHSMARKCR